MAQTKWTKEGMKNLLKVIMPAPVAAWVSEKDSDDWVEFTKELASDCCWAEDRDEATSLRDWLTEQLEAK